MIPTRDVPQGLNADEYFRLSVQYLLLGWQRQMVTAAKLAIEKRADLSDKLPFSLKAEDYEKIGIALAVVEGAMDIASTASDIFRETYMLLKDAVKSAELALDEIEPVREIRHEVKDALRHFGKEADALFNRAFEELVLPVFGMPGRDLPEHLLAPEYFEMARRYKSLGWCEQARDALDKTIEYTSDPKLEHRARQYLISRIPRLPVPHRAVQQNIKGHHQLMRGDLHRARRTFERVVEEYPDFEWARGNLGLVYCQLGDLGQAEQVLSDVLDYNPNYLNAWLHLARLKAAKLEVREAQRYLDKALRLDPEDEPAHALKQLIEFLML